MYITLKLQMKPNDYHIKLLTNYSKTFKQEIFKVCGVFKKQKCIFEYRFKNISNDISWHSKGIVLTKAKEMYCANSEGRLANLEFSSIWSTKSFYINMHNHTIEFKLGLNQNFRIIRVPVYWTEHLENRLRNSFPFSIMICQKGTQWIAYISTKIVEEFNTNTKVLGVDVGIKVPAVTATSEGKIKFFGNGREIRFYQRQYRSKYQALQKQRKHKKMKQMHHKLHNILRNFDHKIAKEIIDYALLENVGMIKMEKLKYINKTFDINVLSNIYLWSYRRLQYMIEYKANLNGIRIAYVNPKNTSKTCPNCGTLNSPKDRLYLCKHCNYQNHRDIVGAINISRAL